MDLNLNPSQTQYPIHSKVAPTTNEPQMPHFTSEIGFPTPLEADTVQFKGCCD